MSTHNTQPSVLLIGKSQRVLDEAVAGLRDLGYCAEATHDFTDLTTRFDAKEVDLVVLGGQVPPARKAELRDEIGAINPQVMFVPGLAGIPGLIVNQVQSAFAANHRDPTRAPIYLHESRSIRLTLANPADVKVTVWWQTSFVPPDPGSDSRTLLVGRVAAGEHTVCVPDAVPDQSAFASVAIGEAIYTLGISTEE
jgi:hypothetical protein